MSKEITPEVAVMAALIEQYAVSSGGYRCTPKSAVEAAEALWVCGYRKAVESVDAGQNARLRTAEDRLARLEGWAGMPSYYSPPSG